MVELDLCSARLDLSSYPRLIASRHQAPPALHSHLHHLWLIQSVPPESVGQDSPQAEKDCTGIANFADSSFLTTFRADAFSVKVKVHVVTWLLP